MCEILGQRVAKGATFDFREVVSIRSLRMMAAMERGRFVARMVAGTTYLEGYVVEQELKDEIADKTAHELLAGPPRNLWSPLPIGASNAQRRDRQDTVTAPA